MTAMTPDRLLHTNGTRRSGQAKTKAPLAGENAGGFSDEGGDDISSSVSGNIGPGHAPANGSAAVPAVPGPRVLHHPNVRAKEAEVWVARRLQAQTSYPFNVNWACYGYATVTSATGACGAPVLITRY